MRRLRDFGWLVFAGVASLFGVVESLGVLGEIRAHNWFVAATAPFFVLGAYWLSAGAWLRTERGREDLGDPPPEPPALTARRAGTQIVVAFVCALACGGAFGWQWIMTR